jgi:hypothetical protein
MVTSYRPAGIAVRPDTFTWWISTASGIAGSVVRTTSSSVKQARTPSTYSSPTVASPTRHRRFSSRSTIDPQTKKLRYPSGSSDPGDAAALALRA